MRYGAEILINDIIINNNNSNTNSLKFGAGVSAYEMSVASRRKTTNKKKKKSKIQKFLDSQQKSNNLADSTF